MRERSAASVTNGEEAGVLVDARIEQLALPAVVGFDGGESADGFVVGQYAQDIDAEAGRSVVEAVLLRMDLEAQVARESWASHIPGNHHGR